MKRICSKPGCLRDRRPFGRYCKRCAAAATQAWRADPDVRRRERARVFTPKEQIIRTARAYVAEYVKRGKLTKADCPCGRGDVAAVWNDPTKPLEVAWLCRDCRANWREDREVAAEGQRRLAADFRDLLQLPPEIRNRLDVEAREGLGGVPAEPGTLRYTIALRLAHQRFLHRDDDAFWA